MMKKTVLASLLTLASGAAMANGFYAGIGAGGMDFNNDQTVTTVSDHTSTITATDQGNVGINGTVFAGHAWVFQDKLFLALEAFGDYTSAKVTNETTVNGAKTTDLKTQLNYVYGARVLPGYKLTTETDAYVILGVARANVKVTDAGSNSSNYYFNGAQMGVGTMTELTHNLGLRGDIIYTGYKNQTIHGSDAANTVKMQLATLEGDVSLVYTFG